MSKEKSQTFCILPWLHNFVEANGNVWPCCMSQRGSPVHNLKGSNLVAAANSDEMKKLRLDMISGKKSSRCETCYQSEASGQESFRLFSNTRHKSEFHLVDEMKEDGSLPNFKLKYLDIRLSNVCNMKCRTCWHEASTSWYDDALELNLIDQSKSQLLNPYHDFDQFISQMDEVLDDIDYIYFGGGEPLLTAEHYEILKLLIKKGKTDTQIRYNTNLSTLSFGENSIIDLWKEFDHITIAASLDASGTKAEYIRSGTNWPSIVKNRKKLLDSNVSHDFFIGPTVSVLNVFHLPDFWKECIETGWIQPTEFRFNFIYDPDYYRIDILPSTLKGKVERKYSLFLDWVRNEVNKDDAQVIEKRINSLLNHMNGKDNSHLIKKFKAMTKQLDKLREESLKEVLPELAELMD